MTLGFGQSAGLKVGVLISGRGSNLGALISASRDPEFGASIVVAIASKPSAAGLELARDAGIPAFGLSAPRKAEGALAAERFETEIEELLRRHEVELVCLAGYMRLLSAAFVERWRDRLVNIHPSLLPSFKGLHVHERVLAAGVRLTGCTVHFVRAEMDDGPILVQAAVPVLPDDDAERLAARVLLAEHKAYPLALRLLACGAATVLDERVVLKPGRLPGQVREGAMLLNPGSFQGS